jgi:hypothetical protein
MSQMNRELKQIKENRNNIEVLDSTQYYILDELDSIKSIYNKAIGELKPLDDFFNAIGFTESRNNYNCVNSFGYIGKYQFGSSALVATGVCGDYDEAKLFRDKFINTPDSLRNNVWTPFEQDIAMARLIKIHKSQLNDYIIEYHGTIVNGILITESGILAAAHLSGGGGVKEYFESNINKTDGYGTTIESYLTKFGGYSVSFGNSLI